MGRKRHMDLDAGEGYHPLRDTLSEDDWDRLDIFVTTGEGEATLEEIEAYADYLFDELSLRVSNCLGVLTVQ
jgi:hypothetical protein